MDAIWLTLYGIVSVVALVQTVLLGIQTWEHRRYGRSCMAKLDAARPKGRVALFAPCKGLDVYLEGNLRAIFEQDYPDYEVTFIVESDDDPACDVVRRLIAEHDGVASRLVVAGKSVTSGQKVHNLRAATASVSDDVEYLAFIDSDARPRREWLRMLIARFEGHRLGAVTGYRWFVPERNSLVNLLLYSLNCDVMSLLGRSSHYLVWGGSWAIRRDVFDQIGLRDAWKGTLSDDLVATQVLRRAKLPVRFEPACVVASPVNYDAAGMLSFVRRQYLVGRHYTPDWWILALFASTFTTLSWAAQVAAWGWALADGPLSPWLPVAVGATLFGTYVYRGRVRQQMVDVYFPQRGAELDAARRFDIWLNPLGVMVNWLGVFASMFGRHITWRNIRYRMGRHGKITALSRLGEAAIADGDAPATATPDLVPFPTTVENERREEQPQLKKAG